MATLSQDVLPEAPAAVPCAEPAAVDKSFKIIQDASNAFECNICLELSKDPVVTLCGHLYCWPCLYRQVLAVYSTHRDVLYAWTLPGTISRRSIDSLVALFSGGCKCRTTRAPAPCVKREWTLIRYAKALCEACGHLFVTREHMQVQTGNRR